MKKRNALLGVAVAGASAAGVGMVSTGADAAGAVITTAVNIPIPANIDGVYLNVVSLQTGTAGFAGYDVNIYSVGTGVSFFTSATANATATNRGYLTAISGGPVSNLTTGAVVDASGIYATTTAAGTNFTAGVSGIVGFRFFNEVDAGLHFGYITFLPPTGSTAPTTAGTITSISYESIAGAPITVGGVVPEPTSLGLLAAGAVGLLARRNKRVA